MFCPLLTTAETRELERRTNLALQSSPEDFKSWDETLWWRNYSFVKNCNCWFAMLPSKMTWFNIEKKCVCIKTVKNLTFCDSLAIILWRDNQPYKTTMYYLCSTIYSFFWWFWCKKSRTRSEVLQETWKLDCYLFCLLFLFFALPLLEKKLKHKKRKWKWLHHHIVTACRSARNIKPEEKLAYL